LTAGGGGEILMKISDTGDIQWNIPYPISWGLSSTSDSLREAYHAVLPRKYLYQAVHVDSPHRTGQLAVTAEGLYRWLRANERNDATDYAIDWGNAGPAPGGYFFAGSITTAFKSDSADFPK